MHRFTFSHSLLSNIARSFKAARLHLGLPVGVIAVWLAFLCPASAQTAIWNQSAGGDFNTPGNWSTNAVPGAGDTALFNIVMSGNVALSADAAPGSISFDTNATSFSLGALGGNALTTANGGAISILPTLAAAGQTFTINAPFILTPNSTTTPGAFAIQNDGPSASTTLVIAGGISSSATSGTETLTLAGSNTGANLISGNITNGGAASLNLVKSGAGTWTLSGANTYTGGTNIAAGKLVLSGGSNRLLSTGTLNFTGSSGTLDVGSTSQTLGGLTFLIAGTNSNVITGAGGTLSVTGGSIQIGGGSTTATGSNSTTVDMSGLGTFSYSNVTGAFSVGGRADVSTSVSGSGMLTMAATNTITAASFIVSPFSSGLSSPNTGVVHLGQTNTINASIITVGVGKSTSTLDFQNLASPTLKIRGTGGTDSDRAALTIGSNDSGQVVNLATMDLTSGGLVSSTLDAMISTLLIGQNVRNNTSAGLASTAIFTMGLGTLNATTIILGQQGALSGANTFSGAATGTLNLKGGTITTTTLTLANKLSGAAAQTITSNFNLYSGALYATTIQRGTAGTGAGAGTATVNFNWVDGTIGNVTGANMTVNGNTTLNGLTGGLNIVLNNTGNTSGTHTWNVSATQTATVQNTVTLSGAGGLTKTGAGMLILAGSNSYMGPTAITSGTVQFGLETSLYNGSTASWTDTNFVVSPGAAAIFNVGGPGEFTVADISKLNALGTATTGFMSGSFLGLDTTNAPGVFTYGSVIANSNGGSNVLGLIKLGTGTLELTAANTYNGGTSIAAGTLALSGGDNRLLSTGTLSFSGSSGTLDVGSTSQTLRGITFPTVGTASHVITGAGGSLTVNSGNIQIGGGNATASGSETLDMSGLGTFNYINTSGNFYVGGMADNASGAITGSGVLTLAATNTITAVNFKINPFSTGLSSLNSGAVHLGQTNIINATTILIGEQKTIALLDFQAGLVNPTLKIRGTGGTDADRAAVTVGYNASGVLASDSTVDLISGVTGASTLDARISTLLIGQSTRNGTAGKAVTGTFLMGMGVMDATTIILGQQAAITAGNSSGQATATLSLSGGTIRVTTFTLADKLSGAVAQTITSNFNLYSGTLNATTIQRGAAGTGAGADTATINFNWVDGTIGNVAGTDMTVNGNTAVNGLTGGLNIVLNNTGNISGTHTWNVGGTLTGTVQTAIIQSTAILSGSGGLTKTGSGTLVFASANTYTGLTVVTAGELDLNATGGQAVAGNLTVSGGTAKLLQSSQINATKNLVMSGGTFALQGFNQTLANVQVSGGSITSSGGVLTSTNAYDIQSGVVSAILAGTAGLSKTTAGTAVLSGANIFAGGTTVMGGTLIGASTAALGSNSGLSIGSGATFAYRPSVAGSLSIGSGVLTLAGGSTIGTALGGTLSQSVLTSSAAAAASGSVGVAVYFIPGSTLTTGVNNLITAASGLTSGGASYNLTQIYNATNFTVNNLVATDTALSINVASATALTTAYWKGGLGAGSNVWALSDGTASNWVTNASGTGATPLVPGVGAAVIFSATGATNQGDMVLGANMSVKNLTVNNTQAVMLNADGNTLTIAAGITVNSGAGAVTLNAPVILGATQTWLNNSSNMLTIGGAVSNGAFVLTTTGSGNTLISGAISGTGGVTKNGAGTLTLSGASVTTGTLTINAGTVNLSGSYTGAVTLSNTSTVFNLQAGGSIYGTNAGFSVGSGAGSVGAFNQSGGEILFNNNFNLGLGGSAASGSYGFYNLTGGTLTDTGGNNVRFRMGGGASYSTGVFYQSGGAVNIIYPNGLEVGANASTNLLSATGVAYLTGGTFTALSNRIGYNGVNTNANGIRGEQTVAGDAVITINGATSLGLAADDVGILNLNGGVYATKQIIKTNGTGIVNFNGGTLKAAVSASTGSFLTGLTSANVFAGGLTVDSSGLTITIAQSLLAPAGSGVTTIAVTNGGAGYVGAPYIAISGTGSGATAVANMVDDGTGNGTFKIASITITSPGTSYTGTPVVTVTGGGGTGAVLDAAVLAANSSGGITKTGTGTLVLSGTNTYTGATVVNAGGTLAAGSTGAFGINSAATVDGTLRMAGKNNSIGSLAGSFTGIVENASATSATLTVGGDGTSQNYSGIARDGSGGGVLNFVKVGAGTQSLSGDSTYTGTTTVSQGALQIGVAGLGSISASSSVSVNGASATLAGSGAVGGAVTVTSGFIQPGDAGGTSVGTLKVGSLNLTGGGTAVFQIGGVSLNDRITVINSGGLTLDGKLSVTTSLTGDAFNTAFAVGNKYDLLDWTGLLNGSFDVGTLVRDGSQDTGLQFDLPNLSSLGLYWDVSSFLTDGSILVVAPEPSRAMLLLAALGAMLVRRRRRTAGDRL